MKIKENDKEEHGIKMRTRQERYYRKGKTWKYLTSKWGSGMTEINRNICLKDDQHIAEMPEAERIM
jgi:hypothetical protein